MSAEEASGAYLGGIGTMLEVADVCPSCGRTHNDRQYAFLHRGSGQCPELVRSNYPIVSRPAASAESHLVPEPLKVVETDIPISMGSLPLPPKDAEIARRSRHLGVPLLPPTDFGGLF